MSARTKRKKKEIGEISRNVSAAPSALFAFDAARSNRFVRPCAAVSSLWPLSMLAAMHFSISMISRRAETMDSTMRVRALVGRKVNSTRTAVVPPMRKAIQRLRKFWVGVPAEGGQSCRSWSTAALVEQVGEKEERKIVPGTVSSKDARATILIVTIPTAPPF